MNQWLGLQKKDVVSSGGGGLLRHYYKGSLSLALRSLFPEHDWSDWRRVSKSRDPAELVREVGQKMGITKLEDWYEVPAEQLKLRGLDWHVDHAGCVPPLLAAAFVLIHSYFFVARLMRFRRYPHHEFHAWSFKELGSRWWSNPSSRNHCLVWIESVLGIKEPSDWYSVSQDSVLRVPHARALVFNQYGGSLIDMLKDLRHSHQWLEWRFIQVPVGFWDSIENQQRFLDFAARDLSVLTPQDWTKVTSKQLIACGGAGILKRYENSMRRLLNAHHPEIDLSEIP